MGVNSYIYYCISLMTPVFLLNSFLIFSQKLTGYSGLISRLGFFELVITTTDGVYIDCFQNLRYLHKMSTLETLFIPNIWS